MTDTKLRELLVVIDDHYGRARSLEERRADTQIYIRAFGTIPDEIVEKALYTAFTQCRFQNQLIVDWCAEIKKLLSARQPSANDLWAQAAAAARKIEANLYYQTHGGFIALDGRKLKGEDFKRKTRKSSPPSRWWCSDGLAPRQICRRFSAAAAARICASSSGRASTGLCRMLRLRVCSPRHCPVGQRLRLEVARHEAEKTIPQPDRVRFVCDGWLHPRKHGLLPAGG